jgi:uncharacterized damage-inducible protein DinB
VIQSLADQLAYTVWANQQILDAVEKLDAEKFLRPMGSSFSSVRDTLVHAMWAEWIWLERWEGRSPREVFEPKEFPTLASIRERWKEIEARRAALVGRLGDGEDERRISYVNRRDERWEYTLGRMMQHVVIHSAYHRGQVVTLLRQLGASAPATDYLVFIDTRPGSSA